MRLQRGAGIATATSNQAGNQADRVTAKELRARLVRIVRGAR
jgi:hypothetical protein